MPNTIREIQRIDAVVKTIERNKTNMEIDTFHCTEKHEKPSNLKHNTKWGLPFNVQKWTDWETAFIYTNKFKYILVGFL